MKKIEDDQEPIDAERRKALKKYAKVAAGTSFVALSSKEALAGNCGYGKGAGVGNPNC